MIGAMALHSLEYFPSFPKKEMQALWRNQKGLPLAAPNIVSQEAHSLLLASEELLAWFL